MKGFFATTEPTAAACQHRCLATPGCYHFSYYKQIGTCHLQDAFALRRGTGAGFVSGPFQCWAYLTNQKSYAKVSDVSYLPAALRCAEVGTSWQPAIITEKIPTESSKDDLGGLGRVLSCQAKCSETPGCAYYTLHLTSSECHMANAAATPMRGMLDTIGGTPKCEDQMFVQRKTLANKMFENGNLATSSTLVVLAISCSLAVGAMVLWHRRLFCWSNRGKPLGLGLIGLSTPRAPYNCDCQESEREVASLSSPHAYELAENIEVHV